MTKEKAGSGQGADGSNTTRLGYSRGERDSKFAVIEFTTPHLTFAEDLALYAASGAEGIGIVETKLAIDADDLSRFRASGLKASSCFLEYGSLLPGPLLGGPTNERERLRGLRKSVRRLAPFNPDCCFIVSGPLCERDPRAARRTVVAGLRELAKEANEAGMILALELMHPSLRDQFGFISEINDALQLLDEVGEPNTKLALDMWHLSGQRSQLLRQIEASVARVGSVHINDRSDRPRSWCDRLLPGDGVGNVSEITRILESGGYNGWYELEIASDDGTIADEFPDSLWKWEPDALVRAGRQKWSTILAVAREQHIRSASAR